MAEMVESVKQTKQREALLESEIAQCVVGHPD
jgi:hypothetical protein